MGSAHSGNSLKVQVQIAQPDSPTYSSNPFIPITALALTALTRQLSD